MLSEWVCKATALGLGGDNEILSEVTECHQYNYTGLSRVVVHLYWFAIRNTPCEVPGLHSGNLWQFPWQEER